MCLSVSPERQLFRVAKTFEAGLERRNHNPGVGGFESLSQIAAKELNSIELDLLPLILRDVTRLHPRVQFGNDDPRCILAPEIRASPGLMRETLIIKRVRWASG